MANAGIAQNSTTAKITNINKNGLYKIVLPTQIRSISKEDLSDFRILDSKGNEIQYFYKNTNESIKSCDIIEFNILSETIVPKKQTTVIFENPISNIDSLILTIANYEGEKTYNLSGSNDQKQWYGLSNNNELYDLNSEKGLEISKIISIPKNNYKFLKIELDDKKSLPIKIKKISNNNNYKTAFSDLLPVDSANIKIIEIKSEKKTRIHILFDYEQFLNQIKFDIKEPKLYKRFATIYKIVNTKVKHKFIDQKIELIGFELNADSKNVFNLSNLHEKDFYIEIENQDNQPLEISDIKFFQIPVSIITDLKTTEIYTIKTGNPDAIAPVYDLVNFENSISNNLPIATISEIEMPKLGSKTIQEKPFREQSWFMWVCICTSGIAVFYFSMSLLKDVNKPNS